MQIPETVNLHVWPKCNLACVYCYGSFPERPGTLSGAQWCRIIQLFAEAGVQRVTFSGGEPTLHPDIAAMVVHARSCGLRTSIITNGAKLTDAVLAQLDLVGIDIDSADDAVQSALGRVLPGGASYSAHVAAIAARVHASGVALKLNTVVTQMNLHEDMTNLVLALRPAKWKLLQFVYVRGENDEHAKRLAVSSDEFQSFAARHAHLRRHRVWFVPESATTVRSTYVMVDPAGRLFQHGPDGHVRSGSVLDLGLVRAMEMVGGYDRARFERRGGHVDVRRLPVLGGAR